MAKPRAKSMPTPRAPTAPAVAYEPTAREEETLARYRQRHRASSPAPRMKVEPKDGTSIVGPDHPDVATGNALLMEAIGTSSPEFLYPFLLQLANTGSKGATPDQAGLNFMLSVVKGVQPRDEVEAMLAAQMAAVHMATMTFARRLAHVENIPQQDSAERAFNKLARTFTGQVEALKRYRSDGQQTVRVERVTVEAGGQAIVGNVSRAPGGGGVGAENGGQPHGPGHERTLGHTPGAPLRSQDAGREPVPTGGGERADEVQDARGSARKRGTQG